MGVGLDLSRALRVGTAGHDQRRIGRAGSTIWRAPLLPLGLYGTGVGQVPIHLCPEDAVINASGNVTSLANRGGAGAYFDAAGTGALTRSDGLLNGSGSAYLTLSNAADLVGVRLFVIARQASAGGSVLFSGINAGTGDGQRTQLQWQDQYARLNVQRWNGTGFAYTYTASSPSLGTALHLVEIEIAAGTLKLVIDGIARGTVACAYPNLLCRTIFTGYNNGPPMGAGDVVSLITDGSAARDGAITTIRQQLAGKYGISLG